ncbi:unnamed protein product [Schistocephalus solidus]|uniref:Rho GTPase-activating protein 7 n=1 Tax=Schistocephalus solidus TaxID=70667 RepID=A0A183SY56_SCHSO|nr:unnamed protein product [Schistocephalus solidus]
MGSSVTKSSRGLPDEGHTIQVLSAERQQPNEYTEKEQQQQQQQRREEQEEDEQEVEDDYGDSASDSDGQAHELVINVQETRPKDATSLTSITPLGSPLLISTTVETKEKVETKLEAETVKCTEKPLEPARNERTQPKANTKGPNEEIPAPPALRIPPRREFETGIPRPRTLCEKYPHVYRRARESLVPLLKLEDRDGRSACKATPLLYDTVSLRSTETARRTASPTKERQTSGQVWNFSQYNFRKPPTYRRNLSSAMRSPCESQMTRWMTTKFGQSSWVHHPANGLKLSRVNPKSEAVPSSTPKSISTRGREQLSEDEKVASWQQFMGDLDCFCDQKWPRKQRHLSKRGYMNVLFNRASGDLLSLDETQELNLSCSSHTNSPNKTPGDSQSATKGRRLRKSVGPRSNVDIKANALRRSRIGTNVSMSSLYSRRRSGPQTAVSVRQISRENCLDELSRMTLAEINYPLDRQRLVFRESRSDGDTVL